MGEQRYRSKADIPHPITIYYCFETISFMYIIKLTFKMYLIIKIHIIAFFFRSVISNGYSYYNQQTNFEI